MPHVREPILEPVAIDSLRPTQLTVGMREVENKRLRPRERKEKKLGKFVGSHMIPVVLGPKRCHHIIDHHHLALALHLEGWRDVFVVVISDLSALAEDAFWYVLEHRNWLYLYDGHGERRDVADLPKSVTHLKDDPFRSLAGEIRRGGGFAKDTTPYSEFLWAHFFRQRMKRSVVKADFEAAAAEALRLARSKEAAYLPGWCGPKEDA
jgi:hypothetical protein